MRVKREDSVMGKMITCLTPTETNAGQLNRLVKTKQLSVKVSESWDSI